MKAYLLFFMLLTLTGWTYAQGDGSIDNIQVSQRTGEEERVVDIAFTLSGGDYYAIKLDIKFHEDDEYTPIDTDEIIDLDPAHIIDEHLDETIEGAIILAQGDVELTWDGRESFAEIDAAAARVEITATRGMRDIDGNFYKSVIIDDQEWMAENLRTTRDADGYDITRYCYNNNTTNCELYGGLYTWEIVMNGENSSSSNPSDVQGICPDGWHVPSHHEWTQLEQYICNALGNSNCETQFPYDHSTTGSRGTNEGNALKSCRQVGSPLGGDCNTSEHPRWDSSFENVHGFDEVGFSALPGGERWSSGAFYNLGEYGYWWSSTNGSDTEGWL
ncbi:MAG: fibrobacter succinogenes major paralogous domain-containing protein, partial [Bacteroidales bacterium]